MPINDKELFSFSPLPMNKEIFYLETNTQPGLTSISLVPEQAKYKNISFEKIVLELIKNFNE